MSGIIVDFQARQLNSKAGEMFNTASESTRAYLSWLAAATLAGGLEVAPIDKSLLIFLPGTYLDRDIWFAQQHKTWPENELGNGKPMPANWVLRFSNPLQAIAALHFYNERRTP